MKREVIIIGAGLAGLSAAIYLGRARRNTLVVHHGKSMARWEPEVQNYLGFPDGISGEDLLARGETQARTYGVEFQEEEIMHVRRIAHGFAVCGQTSEWECGRLLLTTGIYHVPPELPGVRECLGHSMFFCKDCDGCRVQGKPIAIYGWNNEAVEYALAMLLYSPQVAIVTDARQPKWDEVHAAWVREYKIPVLLSDIVGIERDGCQLKALCFGAGPKLLLDALFTTRGDVYYNQLAKDLGAKVDPEGQIIVNDRMATSVPGLYAAGCVTPANCQMIIAAGEGATAAQAINRDLFEESLANHSLRRFRDRQVQNEDTTPEVVMGQKP